MNKKIVLVIMSLLTVGVVGMAVISSYGSITGYVEVEKAIKLDIMGSSNDANYTLSAKQGETTYSPQIKIDNSANASLLANITVSILSESAGNENDVSLSFVNEFKNETLSNPVLITSGDFRIYLKHEFDPAASTGNYSFRIDVLPV